MLTAVEGSPRLAFFTRTRVKMRIPLIHGSFEKTFPGSKTYLPDFDNISDWLS